MDTSKAFHAEIAVIGSLLTGEHSWEEIEGELKEDDFHVFYLRRAFNAIQEMKKSDSSCKTDFITVSSHIHATMGENETDVFNELANVANATFSTANLKAYAQIVKEQSNRRKTVSLLNYTAQKINNEDENYLDFLHKGLTDIENGVPFMITAYAEILDRTMARIEQECKQDGVTGLATGFLDLDDYISGLQKGQLIVLGARPSMGKTTLMMNIADNIACLNSNHPCVLFSLEMQESDICKRTLSRVTKIPGDQIFRGKVLAKDWGRIGKGFESLASSLLFINDRSALNVYQMRAYCRKVRNQHGLKAVFIDYIGLMDGEGENETLKIGNISRDLKALAKDFDIPVFVLSQLNRNIEARKDRTPQLSDLRQSGNIEQDADVILFLDRDVEDGREATLYVAKNRNGRIGRFKLSMDASFFEFKNYMGL